MTWKQLLLKEILYVFIYLGLPTAIFAAAAPFLFFARAIVILDYVFLCLVAPFVSRRSLIILWLLIFVVDVSYSVAPTYHFSGFDFLQNAYAVAFMSSHVFILSGALVCVTVLGLFTVSREFLSSVSTISRKSRSLVITMAVVLFVLDIMNGTNGIAMRSWKGVDQNIAGAHLHKLASDVIGIRRSHGKSNSLESPIKALGATSQLLKIIVDGRTPVEGKILLVVVESFGVPISEKLKQRFAEPFMNPELRARYAVRQGEVRYSGNTVAGEIRELCGLQVFRTDDARSIDVDNCLPRMLRILGYQTTALHGYSPYMFDRNSWYPRLGFDNIFFVGDIDRTGYTARCGNVFRGSCDSEVAQLVRLQLDHDEKERKHFVYWLTLNSHLPIARDTSLTQKLDCTELVLEDDTENHQEACQLSSLLLGLMHAIVRIANTTSGELRIIIVGDHAPPFGLIKDRSLFRPDVVPFIELTSNGRK